MIVLAVERPDAPDVHPLIDAARAWADSLYPAESNHGLGAGALLDPAVTFLVAREDGRAVGCGACVRTGAGEAELKSMWVEPAARGRGLARRLLDRLEAIARADGIRTLRLETGIRQPEALALYRRTGFVATGAFGAYKAAPLSVYMAKTLDGRC